VGEQGLDADAERGNRTILGNRKRRGERLFFCLSCLSRPPDLHLRPRALFPSSPRCLHAPALEDASWKGVWPSLWCAEVGRYSGSFGMLFGGTAELGCRHDHRTLGTLHSGFKVRTLQAGSIKCTVVQYSPPFSSIPCPSVRRGSCGCRCRCKCFLLPKYRLTTRFVTLDPSHPAPAACPSAEP